MNRMAVFPFLASSALLPLYAEARPQYLIGAARVVYVEQSGLGKVVTDFSRSDLDEALAYAVAALGYPEVAIVAKSFVDAAASGQAVEGVDVGSVWERDRGLEEHFGHIQSPEGYTICRAEARDEVVDCNGTFTGVMRTAPKSGNNIDGLHWYIVAPKPGDLNVNSCSVGGTIIVTYVDASNMQNAECMVADDTSKPAFHFGK